MELLRLLASVFCPPCPSKIASKIAFHPPPATYNFQRTKKGQIILTLTKEASWYMTRPVREIIHICYGVTKTENAIACAFINCNPANRYTVLVSHPNAVDLGDTIAFCLDLCNKSFNCCNFFVYDYAGYGVSTGSPSPKGICDDIRAAYQVLCNRFHKDEKDIILFGHSIGSAPSIDLASERPQIGGLVLVSPLSSGIGTLIPSLTRIWCCDPFPNAVKAKKVKCKTLVIHGTTDLIVPVVHSELILRGLQNKVPPLFLPDADHNDVTNHPEFFDRFYTFLSYELRVDDN